MFKWYRWYIWDTDLATSKHRIAIAKIRQWIPAVQVILVSPSKWVFHRWHHRSGIRKKGPTSLKGKQTEVRNMRPACTKLQKMEAKKDKKYFILWLEMHASIQTQWWSFSGMIWEQILQNLVLYSRGKKEQNYYVR